MIRDVCAMYLLTQPVVDFSSVVFGLRACKNKKLSQAKNASRLSMGDFKVSTYKKQLADEERKFKLKLEKGNPKNVSLKNAPIVSKPKSKAELTKHKERKEGKEKKEKKCLKNKPSVKINLERKLSLTSQKMHSQKQIAPKHMTKPQIPHKYQQSVNDLNLDLKRKPRPPERKKELMKDKDKKSNRGICCFFSGLKNVLCSVMDKRNAPELVEVQTNTIYTSSDNKGPGIKVRKSCLKKPVSSDVTTSATSGTSYDSSSSTSSSDSSSSSSDSSSSSTSYSETTTLYTTDTSKSSGDNRRHKKKKHSRRSRKSEKKHKSKKHSGSTKSSEKKSAEKKAKAKIGASPKVDANKAKVNKLKKEVLKDLK